MKMKKYGIALSALACAGMLSCGVLTAQAVCKNDDHVWGLIYSKSLGYESNAEGHCETVENTYQCYNCGYTECEEEQKPLEAHQFTIYAGDPSGSWVEECDICYYHVEYNP